MNNVMSGILLSIVTLSSYAASYKCAQPSGEYLFSDKPCVVSSIPEDTIMTTSAGKVAKLSTTANPIPMPSEIVDGLFSQIETACQKKDGEALLTQFSTKVQQNYLDNKSPRQTLFDTLSSSCRVFTSIRKEIKKSSDTVLYATKMPSKDILLCFYTARKGLENCKGDIKVTIEKNQFKVDARY